jgi:predicted phosphodiesterase
MAYVMGRFIEKEEDYYRNDMDAVRRCLRGEGEFRKTFTFVYGPRRCGKTSFLLRIGRYAAEGQVACSFIDFMSSLEQVTANAEAVKAQPDGLLLLDEIYSLWPKPQMSELELSQAQAKRAVCLGILTEIATRRAGSLRCVIADVPMLLEALRAEGDALDAVLSSSEPFYIDGFSISEAVSLVCQTKTNRDELLRSEAQRALQADYVSGLALEVSMLGEYLAGGNISDRVGFANFLMTRQVNADRIFPDLSEAEQLLIGLSYHQPTTLKRDYLLPNALAEAESLCRFGLCQWVHGTEGQTLELRGTLLRCRIPKWNNSKANRPVAEIERETLREVLTADGITHYKGIDERQARTQWVVHHLSDLYLGRYSKAKGPGAGTNDSMRVQYTKHVAALPASRRPSMAVISGDLTSVGSMEEWKACKRFLEELRRLLIPLSRTEQYASGEQVVVVPGEHDQEWKLFGQIVKGEELPLEDLDRVGRDADGLFSNFQEVCEAYVTPPFGQRTHGEEAQRPSAVYHNDARVLIVPFNSAVPPSRRELGGRDHFKALLRDSIYGESVKLKAALGSHPGMAPRTPGLDADPDVPADSTFESELRFFVRNEVGVLEAEECNVEQIRTRADSAIRRGGGEPSNTMLKIAVCHHNVHQQDDPLVDLVHAKRFKSALAKEGFSLVLHGHKHFPYSIHERPGSARYRESTSLVTIAAASLGDTRIEMDNDAGSRERTKAGFNELVIRHVIDASNGLTFKVQVTAWEWDDEKRRFEPGPLGEYTF